MQRSGLETLSEIHTKNAGSYSENDYSLVFREQFCVAAADISEELGQPLESLGVLFDQILNTGQPTAAHKHLMEIESNLKTIRADGRGLLLFVVRVVDRKISEQLSAAGYRFTETQNVAQIIARRMQINSKHFRARLDNMYEYAAELKRPGPGIHLACFAIRATVGGGFDVLVTKEARNQLPEVRFPFNTLEKWQMDYLSQMDSFTVSACSKALGLKCADPAASKEEQNFATEFLDTLNALKDQINHPLFADALLIAWPVSVPGQWAENGDKPFQATVIAFRLMLPIQFRAAGERFEFSPLAFFRLQQYEYRNGSDEALFSRMIYREFGPLLMKDNASMVTTQKSSRSPTFIGRAFDGLKSKRTKDDHISFGVPISNTRNTSDSSSERKLVDAQGFGGIMVSQEVSVDVTDSGYGEAGAESNDDLNGVEMLDLGYVDMGTSGRAIKESEDPETFVDVLFARCIESR